MNFKETTRSKLIELNCFTPKHLAAYVELNRHKFNEMDILKIAEENGGRNNLDALLSWFEPLQNEKGLVMHDAEGRVITQWGRLEAVDFSDRYLPVLLAYNDGFKSLAALVALFQPLPSAEGNVMPDAGGLEITQWTRLEALGFTVANLLSLLSYDGGSNNLAALLGLFEPLRNADRDVMRDAEGGKITQWTRLKALGFTAANLVAVLNHSSGPKNLSALLSLFKPLQNAGGQEMPDAGGLEITQWTSLAAFGFTVANLVAVLNHNGGSHNLAALVELFKPLQNADGDVMRDAEGSEITQWTRLKALGFTAANLVAVLGHHSGSNNLWVLLSLFEPLSVKEGKEILGRDAVELGLKESNGSNVTKFSILLEAGFAQDNILLILSRASGGNNLEALCELAARVDVRKFVSAQPLLREAVYRLAAGPSKSTHLRLMKRMIERDHLESGANVESLIQECNRITKLSAKKLEANLPKDLMDIDPLGVEKKPKGMKATKKRVETEASAASVSDEGAASNHSVVARAGISRKYTRLESFSLPVMPSDAGVEKLTRADFAGSLGFVQLETLGFYGEPDDDSLMQSPIHISDGKTSVKMTLHTYKSDICRTDRPVFIFAGRKTSAYVPNVGAGDSHIRTILVGTASDLALLAKYLRPDIDFLCIEELSTLSHGKYEQLGLLNSRRIGAFLCALYFKAHHDINYALMSDDNIEALHIRTDEHSWDSGFNELSKELLRANSVCVSVATIAANGIRRLRNNELGSKLFMYDLKRLRRKLGADASHGFVPFFPNNGNALWGEDYFFQIMFAVLFANDEVRGFHVLDAEKYGISRAPLASLCKKVVKTADSLCGMTPKHLFADGYSALHGFRAPVDDAIKTLATLIGENMEAYRRQLSVYKNTDLMRAHTQANGLLYKAPSEPPAINEYDFLIELKQQLRTVIDRGYLHVYQKNILNKVVETLSRERFQGLFNMATGTGKTYIQIHLAIAALLTGTRRPIVLVTPLMALVEQAFRDCVEVLSKLPFLPIEVCQVLKVDSHASSVSVDALRLNRSLDGKGCILIACQDSYQKILESENAAMRPYQTPCMLLVDECHLQEGVMASYLTAGASFLGCLSGTPSSTLSNFTTIAYSRDMAVVAGNLTPCILDRFAVPYHADTVDTIIRNMPSFLNNTPAPSGGVLSDYKVIIYVPNNKKDSSYSKGLKRALDNAGIASFEINSGEADSPEHIKAYKNYQASTGDTKVLICKGMLREGFSDNGTSVVIYLRQGDAASFAQAAGRAMRLSSPQKIAYVIAFNDVKADLVFKDSSTCFADEKALTRARPTYKAHREATKGSIAIEASPDADLPPSQRVAVDAFLSEGEWEMEEELASSDRGVVPVVNTPALETDLKRGQQSAELDCLPNRKVASYCSFFQGPLETAMSQLEALEKAASNTIENGAGFPFGALHYLLQELHQLPAERLNPDVLRRLIYNVLYVLLDVNPDIHELIIDAESRWIELIDSVGEGLQYVEPAV